MGLAAREEQESLRRIPLQPPERASAVIDRVISPNSTWGALPGERNVRNGPRQDRTGQAPHVAAARVTASQHGWQS